eukprot:4469028-Amphidinium_carterae.1
MFLGPNFCDNVPVHRPKLQKKKLPTNPEDGLFGRMPTPTKLRGFVPGQTCSHHSLGDSIP